MIALQLWNGHVRPVLSPRGVVDYILSGPAKIEFMMPICFSNQTHSNPCDFNDLLQALRSNVTIRQVKCYMCQNMGFTEDEWVLLVQTLGCIAGIQNMCFIIDHVSYYYSFQAISDAVNSAHSLHTLSISLNQLIIPGDPSGLTVLANALRQHPVLHSFHWRFFILPPSAQQHDMPPDSVFRALSASPKLQKVSIETTCASADAIRNLLHLRQGTILHLEIEPDHWMTVAEEILQGRCRVRGLVLEMYRGSSERDTAAVKAIAEAIRRDDNLEGLFLIMRRSSNFSNDAIVALAEALTVNTRLHVVRLHDTYGLGAPAYEAFGAMHRVNTNISLELSPYVNDIGDERRLELYNQMRIEQRLNSAGRGTLLSVDHSPREEWVHALHELNATNANANESPAFEISCLYSLLRLNPNVCSSQVVEPTTLAVRKAMAAKRMRRGWPWRKP
jgi:hypothetical protein